MIKYVNGKKYIFMSHDCKVSYSCLKCVSWNDTNLCSILNDYCDNGFFTEDNKYMSEAEPPVSTVNQEQPTLRDQFAMATINGLVAGQVYSTYHDAEFAARTAYAFADAMMKERTK